MHLTDNLYPTHQAHLLVSHKPNILLRHRILHKLAQLGDSLRSRLGACAWAVGRDSEEVKPR